MVGQTLKTIANFAIGGVYLSVLAFISLTLLVEKLSSKAKSFVLLLSVVVSLVVIFVCSSGQGQVYTDGNIFDDQNVTSWLNENEHDNLTSLFQQKDLHLKMLSDVDLKDIEKMEGISGQVKLQLGKAVKISLDKKVLNTWLLAEYRIPPDTILKLNAVGVTSVSKLSKISPRNAEKYLSENDFSTYSTLLKAIKAAKYTKPDLEALQQYLSDGPGRPLWVKIFLIFLTLVIGGAILLFIMVADCLTRASRALNSISPNGLRRLTTPSINVRPNIPYQTNTDKGWLWSWLIGDNISTQNCNVVWGWTEPQIVGNIMSFSVQLFKKNGSPYKLKDVRMVNIEILHNGDKITSTSNTDTEKTNTVKVSFTVHKSGMYKIHVRVNGKHIRNSPFTKVFDAGSIDASKTGFTNYCSTIVCTKGQSYPLVIESRDCYDNPAAFKTDHQNYFKIKVLETESNERYVPTTQIFNNPDNRQLVMHIKMEHEGCYQASVSYGDVKLRNGDFNILVISGDDLETVNKTTAKKSHNLWYEARLLSDGVNSEEKAKKVYVYISPKQLTVKEYFLKIIGKKLHTWRVCPSTKFSFVGYNSRYDAPVMKIYDCSQLPVMLATKDRNIIAATFTNFLLRNIGGSETFQDKRVFFFQELKKLNKKGNVSLKIDRANLLYSSYKVYKSLYASDWFKTFNIEFLNELGLDWGGLRREWVQILCTELFDPDRSGLFTRFTDHSQGLIHPRFNAGVKLKYYELAGKIVGKCLIDSSLGSSTQLFIKAKFTRSFLAQIIGLQVNYKYFETDDPELYKTKIKFIEENKIEDMELTFSEEEYSDSQLIKSVDLVNNGSKIKVTEENKIHYLNCLAQYKLVTCVKEEVESFLKGLNSLVSDNLLSIFDEHELELLMCGTDNYSFTDFKQHADTSELFGKQVLEWFWAIVAGFTDEQMARLLQFTTGSSQLPPGGFKDLDPKFTITYTSYSFDSLPMAHTCFNQLCIPTYTSMEQMHKMMLTAINEGFQGFGFV